MSDTRPPPILPTHKPAQQLERYSEADVPTGRGMLRTIVFRDRRNGREHVALVVGDVAGREGVPVRVHSECLTSEVFGSLKCDCREQLDRALDFVFQNGCGVVLYLRQEGRGIGLTNKLHAYKLQDQGYDTVEANLKLGLPADKREYGIGSQILRDLGLSKLRIMTNNPKKIYGIDGFGLQVVEEVPIRIEAGEYNRKYLETKRVRMGHRL